MKSKIILSFAVTLCTFFPVAANADTFNFSFVFGDVTNVATVTSAVLTTTDTPVGGAYTITGITGTYDFYIDGALDVSRSIAGLFIPDTSYSADDLLYLNGGPYLDISGLTFTLAGGTYGGDDFLGDVNIYYNSDNKGYYEPIEITTDPGTLTVTPASSAVPEPASFSLAAVAGLAIFGFRRRLFGWRA